MTYSWLNQQIAAASQGKIGLIDIGSNSVRLVVYDRLKRAPASIYNEKVMCQLGKGLASSGKLNPEGITMAKAAIARFVALAKNMEVTALDAIATAAVREAEDGPAFVDYLERTHNLFIEVISGRREAKLGAYGILSSIHQAEGQIADLGGGSLELVGLDQNQRIGERMSFPLGVLRLLDECDGTKAIRKKVRQTLKQETWLSSQPGTTFYAIGGSFRNLARVHSISTDYPLPLTHAYSVDAKALLPTLKAVSQASPMEVAAMAGASKKRASVLPAAAIVLSELMRMTDSTTVTFSASGIREGYMYEKLSPFVREEDGLIAACVDVASNINLSISYARELYDWIQRALKKQSESSMRLAYAVCLLQDIARYIHPDHRAAWSYRRIIESNLTGLNHKQRVQLALTLYHRYRFKCKDSLDATQLLDERSRHWAMLVGALASLAHNLTGGVEGHLTDIRLDVDAVTLALPEHMQSLIGETIDKHLEYIGQAYAAWKAHK